jgi:hypothetical protein
MPGVKATMKEWKAGKLHSGSKKGPVVKSQKQAVAIALTEQRKARGQAARLKKHAKGGKQV